MRRFTNDYNPDGKEKRREARDGDKSNDEWWNLLALCQKCHLQFQVKVDPEVVWFLEHSEWVKPYVAGFYANKYEHRKITREEAMTRLDELLAYELRV